MRSSSYSLLAGLTGIVGLLACPDSPTPSLVVNTAYGAVQGAPSEYRDGVTVFKGIPFGGPTSGSQRWKAPTAPAKWTGVLNATTWGPQCAALAGEATLFTSADPTVSEDCLYLNIWKPSTAQPGDQLPVYVFIYGGRFEVGSGEVTTYEASGLAMQNIVAVNFNYRLGPFGFLAHPDLSAESGHNSSGNYGLLDQLAALQWVRDNIAQFGGNPDHIVVGGQSAGSASSLDMMYSPLTKDLGIQGIISESGARGPHDPMTGSTATSYRTKSAAEAEGITFLSQVNATSIAELRALPMTTLINKDMMDDTIFANTPFANNSAFMEPPLWRPVIDGYILPHGYGESLRLNSHLDVPILTGNNKDESGALENPGLTTTTYQQQFAPMFGNLTSEFFHLYPAHNDSQASSSANAFYRDVSRVGTWMWAKDWHAGGARSKVFTYYWTHAAGNSGAAGHGSELYFVFNNIPYGDSLNVTFYEADYAVEAIMVQYWANFIRTGNPNGHNLTHFPSSEWAPATMWLGDSWGVGPISDSSGRIAFLEKWMGYQGEW
ncbi:alpha/beta-hydrolase [Aspergillus sclerotiicarbonarius CBS 121057]|uniref:Carboxylic ester hydrolase n=1 Tax=Aspergillus sclerotiicarbonarius (strain CBS 121057 / IBT 28362) TaxID=1448318 RepID=A0A319ETL3_ASPSB|nr:alpha/beta-hydrolase [Aspergillus sclerotiicarbonarius CBS 121057]